MIQALDHLDFFTQGMQAEVRLAQREAFRVVGDLLAMLDGEALAERQLAQLIQREVDGVVAAIVARTLGAFDAMPVPAELVLIDDGSTDEASDDETVTFEDVLPDIAMTKTANPTSVPETGGDTLFCDMNAAYEGLSDEIKDRIEGLVAEHDYMQAFGHTISGADAAAMRELMGGQPLWLWDNYPVNDADRRRDLYLGAILGRGLDLFEEVDGVWVPMEAVMVPGSSGRCATTAL